MVALQEICAYSDEALQVEEFQDYCPNGLQVEGKDEAHKVLTSVSASLATIEQAIEQNVDLLLVHHGLFWKGDSWPVVGTKRKKLALLLEHSISLLAYHLPLDAHDLWGNNWAAAKQLGWEELEPFQGIGVKGTFKPMKRSLFCEQLVDFYGHPANKAEGGDELVRSAALISGGAYRELEAASKEVDVFITGNFDEPAWHIAHEEKINFYAMGHYATEVIGVQTFGKHLEEQFGIEVVNWVEENPF